MCFWTIETKDPGTKPGSIRSPGLVKDEFYQGFPIPLPTSRLSGGFFSFRAIVPDHGMPSALDFAFRTKSRSTPLSEERTSSRRLLSPLANNPEAPAIFVEHPEDMMHCFDALRLRTGRPVLVFIGGADGLDPVVGQRVTALLQDHLLPLLASLDAVVVDGGTDAGIMACAGQANAIGSVALVGVAAIGTVAVPGLDDALTGETALEPNHSHFLFVPGDRWGDESRWLSLAATTLAGPFPTVTLVVGGGEITRLDISHSLAAERTVILLTGTGGVADELSACPASAIPDDRVSTGSETAASFIIVDLDEAAERLPCHIRRVLSRDLAARTI